MDLNQKLLVYNNAAWDLKSQRLLAARTRLLTLFFHAVITMSTLAAPRSGTELKNSTENQQQFAADVAAAVSAATNIAQTFVTFGNTLKTFDDMNLQPNKFVPDWQNLQKLLVELVVPICTITYRANHSLVAFEQLLTTIQDPSVETAAKVAALHDILTKFEGVQRDSDSLSISLQQLSSDVANSTGNYTGFAKDRLSSDNAQITDYEGKIGSATAEVERMKTGEDAIAELQRQKQTLSDQVSAINTIQNTLNLAPTGDILNLTTHVALLTAVWEDVSDKSTKIVGWLNDGAGDSDIPEVLQIFVNEAETIYLTIGTELQKYSEQIQGLPGSS
ncbi:hypothetical protein FA95DRAFT_1557244 [Auriscalpium vulgare]|uniref:Uncharacterized protein n=1 Tax=Auriscalpium vulgare TaxID=40419 RepID=A0ACB8RYH8_9AGAM|nr:hypothetical protein FA95DRAFT_1557244 [Auriscalpium vulgare]